MENNPALAEDAGAIRDEFDVVEFFHSLDESIIEGVLNGDVRNRNEGELREYLLGTVIPDLAAMVALVWPRDWEGVFMRPDIPIPDSYGPAVCDFCGETFANWSTWRRHFDHCPSAQPFRPARPKPKRKRLADATEVRAELERLLAFAEAETDAGVLTERDLAVYRCMNATAARVGMMEILAAPAWVAAQIGLPDGIASYSAVRRTQDRLERLGYVRKWRKDFQLPRSIQFQRNRQTSHPGIYRLLRPAS